MNTMIDPPADRQDGEEQTTEIVRVLSEHSRVITLLDTRGWECGCGHQEHWTSRTGATHQGHVAETLERTIAARVAAARDDMREAVEASLQANGDGAWMPVRDRVRAAIAAPYPPGLDADRPGGGA